VDQRYQIKTHIKTLIQTRNHGKIINQKKIILLLELKFKDHLSLLQKSAMIRIREDKWKRIFPIKLIWE